MTLPRDLAMLPLVVAAVVLAGAGATATPPAAPPATTPPTAPASPPAAGAVPGETQPEEVAAAPVDPLAGLPPQVRIGARSAHVQRNLPVVPVVVVVPDAASYVAAIAGWSIYARYPVLIDDGSWPARQDIARFVRAFRPESVVRWSAGEGSALPDDAQARRAAIENAVAAAWDAADAGSLAARWTEISLTPPGLVATNERDGAWTAALALAAGRGQILVWVPPSRDAVGWHAALGDVDGISRAVESAAEASGHSWEGLGDDLDALTLCLNYPVKIDLGESNKARFWATTDVLGRHRDGERTRRWAWAGQVFGDECRAAYRAMSALFLLPRNAWLFDGYDNNPPWNAWDGTAAAIELERAGIATVVNDNHDQGASDFRLRASGRARGAAAASGGGGGEGGGGAGGATSFGGVRFGLIAVNTHGEPTFFELRPGRALAGDVPLLAHPAAVHFVHSWSAVRPDDRATVGGRFLEHGAYAYIGSVHEPFLQAFAPTPAFARRLIARAPLGVAGRLDGGPPWKIAVLGDPLQTLGPSPARESIGKLPLEGARSLQESLTESLRERRFDAAIADLALLARDEDIARLIRAINADPASRLGPDAALAAAPSLFFAGAFDLFVETYPLAGHGLGADAAMPALRDMLWHTLWPSLATLDSKEVALLRLNMRPEQMARDAAEVYAAISRADGPEAARDFLVRVQNELPGEDARRELAELIKR